MNNSKINNKILFITSFYSGLNDSINNNYWEPKGMPAIVKLLESLKLNSIYFDYIFLSENDDMTIKND